MANLKILLADSHDVLRRGLRSLLESHPGWSICAETRSGLEAIKMAEKLKPGVLILGLDLVDLNGIETTRRIIQAQPDMQILFYTMHDEEYLMIEAVRAGARGHVLKSDGEQTLIEAVCALADRQPYFSTRVAEAMLDFTARTGGTSDPQTLTSRELEIIKLIADGKSNSETAAELKISVKTVEAHRSAIMRKCGFGSITDLVHYAIRHKLIEP